MRSVFLMFPLLCLVFLLGGCTTLLDATREEPIQPDPTKRTFGTYIDDKRLETIATVNINKASPELDASHINVDAYNGVILLTGQVNSGAMRQLAATTVSGIPGVRQVFNELQIQGTTSFVARANDSWLATKARTALMANQDVESSRIKLVCEDGVIYILGMLTATQADKAANIIKNVRGVQKVVKTVEYVEG